MHRTFEGSSFLSVGLALAAMAVSACGEGPNGPPTGGRLTELCLELTRELSSGSIKDGIPALTDPTLVQADDVLADYLLPTDRVIGLDVGGDFIAVPHNILWWHEIVNFNDWGLSATYCPLTGSSIVFFRTGADGAEMGVSGLLFRNNLVMYDRASGDTDRTLWPQMSLGGRCGPAEGQTLSKYPSVEMEWAAWLALHPDTRVLGDETGIVRDYTMYPYGDYEEEDNIFTLAPILDLDTRRLPKERVLGIPFGDGGGRVFPFGALNSIGNLAVVHETMGVSGSEEPIVVFWDSDASAAVAFRPQSGGQDLTFEVTNGAFVDVETGSQWSIDGQALSGPLAGSNLSIIPEAYVSFWFAFSEFFPNLDLWAP